MKPLPKSTYLVRFMRGNQFLAAEFNSPGRAEEFRKILNPQDIYEDTIVFIPSYFEPVDAEEIKDEPSK